MPIFLFLFLLIMPIDILSVSPAPEIPPPPILTPTVSLVEIFYSPVNDYKTKSVYYETIPILAEESTLGLIGFFPLIIQNNVSGEIKLQIKFSFFPTTNTNIQNFSPKSITIASDKRELTLPLINNTSIPSQRSAQISAAHSGILFLFPEDIVNLISLISDAQTIPTITQQTNFLYQEYSLQELQQTYNYSIDQKPFVMIFRDREYQNLFYFPFTDTFDQPRTQQELLIIINNDNKESITMVLSPYYVSFLDHVLNFYNQL